MLREVPIGHVAAPPVLRMRRNDDALSGLGPPGDRHCRDCRPKHSQDREPGRFSTIREKVRGRPGGVCRGDHPIHAEHDGPAVVVMTMERTCVSRRQDRAMPVGSRWPWPCLPSHAHNLRLRGEPYRNLLLDQALRAHDAVITWAMGKATFGSCDPPEYDARIACSCLLIRGCSKHAHAERRLEPFGVALRRRRDGHRRGLPAAAAPGFS
jgi:hypothetical protein